MSDMETAVRSILHKKYSLGLSVGNMVDLQAHLREAVAGLVAADESITDMLNNLRGMDDDFAKLASSLSDDQATQNPD